MNVSCWPLSLIRKAIWTRRNLGGLHDCFTPFTMYFRARNDREPNTCGSILISWVDHSSNAYREHVHAIWRLILTSCSTDRPSGEAEYGTRDPHPGSVCCWPSQIYGWEGRGCGVPERQDGWWRSLDLSKLSRHFSPRCSKRLQFSRFELQTGLTRPPRAKFHRLVEASKLPYFTQYACSSTY